MSLFLDWASKVANMIQHVHEPSRLILAWQAADKLGDRKRFAVGEMKRLPKGMTLTYYDTPEVKEASKLGFEGYPAFSLREREHSKDVLEAFMRRLPPRTRNDFREYLEGLRLRPDVQLSAFALLAYSEAKLPSDGFSLVDTLEGVGAPSEFLWEVAGYRHYAPLSDQAIGSPVSLQLEPNNPFDPNAVSVKLSGRLFGYINRLQAPIVRKWVLEGRTYAVLEKLNGTTERPRAYIFVEYR